MKTLIFYISFIFAFPVFSFGETPDDETPKDNLYAMIGFTYTDIEGNVIVVPPEELAFTGDDIQSFNITTGELIFKDNYYANFSGINIYLNDKTILESILVPKMTSSFTIYDLVFYLDMDCIIQRNRFYLCYFSPWIDINHLEQYEGILNPIGLIILAENIEKRKEGLELFIKYFSDNDKIVENETAIEPPATPELNDFSIYPNPTTGEFRVSGFEFRVGGIEVFDIYGIKQFSTFNFPFSTQIDISHLPAGIYFVRITTEKGVVTKKVVKK